MKFDKDHKVIIETLTKEEARAYIDLLSDEVKRLRKCREEADFMWCMRPIISKIYSLVAIRHEWAILDTRREMERVKERFLL